MNLERLRQKLATNAKDDSLYGYAAAAIQSVVLAATAAAASNAASASHRSERSEAFQNESHRIWAKCTSPLIRRVVTEHADPFDKELRLRDLYDLLKSDFDLALVGKPSSKIYAELRICLSFLRHFAATGAPYPKGW